MYCMCLCLNVCVGSCVVRRACYTLTGRDRWSEMHDGILWWAGRVWINMVDFNSPCCVCVCVCACLCLCVRPSGLSVCPVFTEAFYWSPHESFSLSNIQSSPYPPTSPCWLLNFIFYSLDDALFRLHQSFFYFQIPLHHHYFNHFPTWFNFFFFFVRGHDFGLI